nr:bile acid:sodium symporter family protein [Cyanobium sp. LEGE 06113]
MIGHHCRLRFRPHCSGIPLERFTVLFPVWTLLAVLLALPFPGLFSWLQGGWIVAALALIMLGMGLDLEPADFRRVLLRPLPALIGVAAQFLVMPLLAALVAWWLQLQPPLAVGLILVGCCPGGTASNVVALIARADVALSVVMTTVSTLLAVLLTPLLTSGLAGRYVPVDGWRLLLDVLQVVLLPVVLGVLLKRISPPLARRIAPAMPPLAVLAIVLIVASIVGSQRDALVEQGRLLLLATLLLHAGGFLLGWLIPALLRQPQAVRRTVSLEVGMQNSGLAVVLARSGFAISPLTALPGAISAVVHAVLGSVLAVIWRKTLCRAGRCADDAQSITRNCGNVGQSPDKNPHN